MAGDWLKIEEGMPDKPEVFHIAEALGIEPDAVAGKLIRVWSWASRSCHGDGVTKTTSKRAIDRAAGVVGFADAMIDAGWLLAEGEVLCFPKFDRHNSKTAKERGLAFIRKQNSRRGSVTQTSRADRDKNGTKETETETETEKKKDIGGKPPAAPKFVRPTIEQVAAYCRERKNRVSPERFFAFYESNGWKVGKNPMKDWQASVRSWEANDAARGSPGGSGGRKSVQEHNEEIFDRVFGNGTDGANQAAAEGVLRIEEHHARE